METSSPVCNSALHIHREATAIPRPALTQAITPSAVATCTRPSPAMAVTAPDRVNLQPPRPERPGPAMQSWLGSSAGVFRVALFSQEAGAGTQKRGALSQQTTPAPAGA